ncbi:serine/threonine protein kinase [Myxococcota bacterium]|nr:serine/threonine protein kinase [Myxococcota bacterium]
MSDKGNNIRIIKKLDAGGMAEVYLGELVGIEGISRRVAIKRILPHLSRHSKFVAMFLDEARLATKLSHANIVQTFEVGVKDESYYLVMEFIEGTALKVVMNHYKEKKKLMPMSMSIYIMMEAAKGLGYAHGAKDGNGDRLNIVHRDISPPNILLSVQGEVKLVDFGLAKAASQLEDTEPGVIKGKFSYLSPEAVMGLELDQRADIFSLGIVLYEMLTGKRLFYGATDLETVKLVEKCFIPRISALNPDVPPALEKTLYKALSRDRDRRYARAEDFLDDLNSVLFTYGLKVSHRDVARIVRELRGMSTSEEDGQRKDDFDLSSDSFLTGEFSVTNPDAKKAGAKSKSAVIDDTEDPRSWLQDMDLDLDNIDLSPAPQPRADEEDVEIELDDGELEDDVLEEVLDGSGELKMVSGELEPQDLNSHDLRPPSAEIDYDAPSPVPPGMQSVTPTPGGGPPPLPGADLKAKKGWFSKLFGGGE